MSDSSRDQLLQRRAPGGWRGVPVDCLSCYCRLQLLLGSTYGGGATMSRATFLPCVMTVGAHQGWKV